MENIRTLENRQKRFQNIIFLYILLHFAMFCYVLLCLAMFCYVLLCFARFCYVFAMFCYVIPMFSYVLLCLTDHFPRIPAVGSGGSGGEI